VAHLARVDVLALGDVELVEGLLDAAVDAGLHCFLPPTILTKALET
jgi:hypothetical protein